MPGSRAALETLKGQELINLVENLELEVDDRQARYQLLNALTSAPPDALASALKGLPRTRLKAMRRALGLDDGGRAKAPIAARLLGEATPRAVSA